MVLPGSCHAAFTVLRQIESGVVLEQLGSSLFNTALQMVVKDRSVNATYTDVSEKDSQQKFMTDFFLIYNLIIGLTPILPAMLLARLGDRGWRRTPIMLPLSGYLLSRLALLLVVLFRLPLEVMYGAGVVFGLSGGFCAYWPGVMTLASLGSTAKDRSKVLMRVELLYGGAGLVGSLVSGHLFLLYSSSTQHGSILLSMSTLLHLLCLLHAITLLQVCCVCVCLSSFPSGTILTSLQLALKFASLAYIPAFTKIYQRTLGWFPGFVFTLSSIITVLGMIPICVIGCRSPQKQRYETIQGD
ncbi:thymic stromal cotransporter homolog [Gymnodraco acuticeps]|uniref:Thymic stromal cotransporter homolog n=1 Tax=Gymnodraco acuticeps TaxID=8218 RepID=A0A6P8VG85_GYMAC|nr:thymic stromal cotransporter homolog [Gymnodraco acuticeps]